MLEIPSSRLSIIKWYMTLEDQRRWAKGVPVIASATDLVLSLVGLGATLLAVPLIMQAARRNLRPYNHPKRVVRKR